MMIVERQKALLKQEEVKEHNHKAKCETLEWKKGNNRKIKEVSL